MLDKPSHWDNVAHGYDRITKELFEVYAKAAIDHFRVGAGDTVVDVACGPGTLAMLAARRGAAVSALDFSSQMIKRLRSRVREEATARLDVAQGDGQALPYTNEGFNYAFSMFGLMFFPDRSRGYSDLYRVLKPGGGVCVSSWAPVVESSLLHTMALAVQAIVPNTPLQRYDARSLENPYVVAQELRDAGFVDVEVVAVNASLKSWSAASLWADMSDGSAPIAAIRNALTESEWAKMSQRAVARLEELLTGYPATLYAKAWLGFGAKPGLSRTTLGNSHAQVNSNRADTPLLSPARSCEVGR